MHLYFPLHYNTRYTRLDPALTTNLLHYLLSNVYWINELLQFLNRVQFLIDECCVLIGNVRNYYLTSLFLATVPNVPFNRSPFVRKL